VSPEHPGVPVEPKNSPELEELLSEIEKIRDPHRRRTARAKLMARVGRWVVRHGPASDLSSARPKDVP
jgi:hypothetical protein